MFAACITEGKIICLQENTFQVVLAAGEVISYVFFIYDEIEWGRSGGSFFSNAGFRNADGSQSFMVPGALTQSVVNIDNTSNVGINGLYIYRVDFDYRIVGPDSGIIAE